MTLPAWRGTTVYMPDPKTTPSPSPKPSVPPAFSIASALSGPLSKIGDLVVEKLLDAGRQIGRAEAKADFLLEAHDREVKRAAGQARDDQRARDERKGEAARRGLADQIVDLQKRYGERIATLESIVMMALDAPSKFAAEPGEVATRLSRLDLLRGQGRQAIERVVDGWTLGQRWRALWWLEHSGDRREAPGHVHRLMRNLADKPATDEVDEVEAEAPTMDPTDVYGLVRPYAGRLLPGDVVRWTDKQRAEALQWARDMQRWSSGSSWVVGERPAPPQAPDHVQRHRAPTPQDFPAADASR